MKDKKLREYIRNLISKKLSENKDITKEGIVSGIMNHIGDVLKKSNDKAFEKRLKKLSASGPEGKKAAANLLKNLQTVKDASLEVDDLLDDLGFTG